METKQQINLGVVGATGLVGETFLKLIEERNFPVGKIKLFASPSSAGTKISVNGQPVTVEVLAHNCFDDLDLVFFSSGDDISKTWAPRAVASGAFAVDNSAAFRMDPATELVVPEINLPSEKNTPRIIANPNCSTIQLVMALDGLKEFGLKEVRVSSYQAVSGGGKLALNELKTQSQDFLDKGSFDIGENFSKGIAFSCQPYIGGIDEDGFCSEENKISRETQKILNLPGLPVSAVTIRIPTFNGHGEVVWVTLDKEPSAQEFHKALASTTGVVVDSSTEGFSSLHEITGTDEVYISRIRKDRQLKSTWLMWVSADNLRRGAVTNGIKIAEGLFNLN